MIEIEKLEEWLGREVVDVDGEKLGKLDEIYYAAGGGEPVLMSIKSGVLGRSSMLVPVADASATRSNLRVGRRKADLADAPPAPSADVSGEDVEAVEFFYDMRIVEDRSAGLEGTAARAERARAAEEARARAEALEHDADQRAATAKDAAQRAKEAATEAEHARKKRDEAESQAEVARAEASRAEAARDDAG